MLKIRKMNQYYNESHTLWDIDMNIREGECHCLMGRNGVGKTTLLNSLMGILRTSSEELSFNGNDLNGKPIEARAKMGIGYVPQGRQIFPFLTVLENLTLPAIFTGKNKGGVPDFIYTLFPVLKEMKKRRGGDLSGGQQQQLAIARALMTSPSLLLLDEPTEGIQPNLVSDIIRIIRDLNHEMGLTILLVEQKLPIILKLSGSYSLLDRGRVVSSGEIKNLDDETVGKYLNV